MTTAKIQKRAVAAKQQAQQKEEKRVVAEVSPSAMSLLANKMSKDDSREPAPQKPMLLSMANVS